MGSAMPINGLEYLMHLDHERYRAVIIHTDPFKSPALSDFAKKLCERSNGKYLDLLNLFIDSPELSAAIDQFDPERFLSLLKEQSKAQSLLVVDRMDFILDTWRRNEKQAFFRLVENQWDSFKDGMKCKILLGLQTSQEFETLNIKDSKGQSRVLKLSDFEDLS